MKTVTLKLFNYLITLYVYIGYISYYLSNNYLEQSSQVDTGLSS